MAEQTSALGGVAARPAERQVRVRRWVVVRRALSARFAAFGGLVLVLALAMAVFAPVLAPYDPLKQDQGHLLAPPGGIHPLGTDNLGRDILSRVIWGTRVSLAAGFVSVAGAVAVGAHASEFLLICTGMLALFLGFTKRRQEAMLEAREDAQTRPVLEHYSLPFLDQMIAMVTASAILTYVIYAVDSPRIGSKMLATAPSVLYGIFRYLYLIYDRGDTRSTAAILTEDPGMVFAAVSWVGIALAMLYVFD
jgi:ABC-type antimicrobial peptide transport system permease subunit